MRTHLKRLFSDSIIYGISGVISSLISIFLIPLYTSVFQPSDYGVISILTTTSAFFNILLVFSLDNSAAVLYWDKEDLIERKKTFNSWFWSTIFLGSFLFLLISLFSKPLSNMFFSSGEYSIYFVLIGMNLLFVGFQKITNIWCRVQQQPIKAMIFSIAILLVTVGANILFILVWRTGTIGVFYSQLIASVTGFIFMIYLFREWIGIRFFSFPRLNEMIGISLPLVPASILYWIMNMASIYFLKIYLNDTSEIGLYQLGASVANVLSLGTWAFFQAWTPFALEVSKKPEAQKVYSLVFEIYCIAGFFLAFALMLISEDILILFTNSNYLGSRVVLGLLGINVIIIGIPNILAIANNLVKKNTSYAVGIFLGSIATVFFFVMLIPTYGKEGAAIAMIGGNITVAVYLSFKVQKLYYIPYNFIRIFILVGLQIVCFLLIAEFTKTLLVHIMATLFVGFLLAAFYYFRKNRKFLKAMFF